VVRRGHDCDVGIGKAGDPALERLDPGGRSGERGRLDEVEVRGPGERRLDPAPGRSLRRGQQEIDARSQRDDDIDPLRGVLGQGAHVERVGDRDPFETELFAQDAIHHPAGQRRGHDAAAGERRAGEVTGHDHPGAARDRFPERTQLGDLEVRARAVDDRERVMGIDPDATGAREVLERRDDPRRLDPSGPRSAEPRHRGGIVAERADPLGEVRRVREVHDRGVVHVDADGPELEPDRPADPLGKDRVGRRPDRHRARKRRPARAEGHELAALLVDGDEKRHARCGLEGLREGSHLARRPDVQGPEEREASDWRLGQPLANPARNPDPIEGQHEMAEDRRLEHVGNGTAPSLAL